MTHDPRDLTRLARAPRPVPFGLKLRLRFGDTLGIIGWIFMAVGMLFAVVFGSLVDLTNWDDAKTTEGWALGWEETSSEVNGHPVIANHFAYTVNEVPYEGTSYANSEGLAVDEPVTVEYIPDEPANGRIRGMRSSEFPAWVLLFTGIFPLVGFGLALAQFIKGSRMVTLLQIGQAGLGRLVAKDPTNTRVNNRMVWAMTFEFEDDMGRTHKAVARTVTPHDLEDEPEERLLYHPAHPEKALLMDSLPGLFKVTAAGGWQNVRRGQAIGAALPPLIAIGFSGLLALVLL
jgi:hypothetical protein